MNQLAAIVNSTMPAQDPAGQIAGLWRSPSAEDGPGQPPLMFVTDRAGLFSSLPSGDDLPNDTSDSDAQAGDPGSDLTTAASTLPALPPAQPVAPSPGQGPLIVIPEPLPPSPPVLGVPEAVAVAGLPVVTTEPGAAAGLPVATTVPGAPPVSALSETIPPPAHDPVVTDPGAPVQPAPPSTRTVPEAPVDDAGETGHGGTGQDGGAETGLGADSAAGGASKPMPESVFKASASSGSSMTGVGSLGGSGLGAGLSLGSAGVGFVLGGALGSVAHSFSSGGDSGIGFSFGSSGGSHHRDNGNDRPDGVGPGITPLPPVVHIGTPLPDSKVNGGGTPALPPRPANELPGAGDLPTEAPTRDSGIGAITPPGSGGHAHEHEAPAGQPPPLAPIQPPANNPANVNGTHALITDMQAVITRIQAAIATSNAAIQASRDHLDWAGEAINTAQATIEAMQRRQEQGSAAGELPREPFDAANADIARWTAVVNDEHAFIAHEQRFIDQQTAAIEIMRGIIRQANAELTAWGAQDGIADANANGDDTGQDAAANGGGAAGLPPPAGVIPAGAGDAGPQEADDVPAQLPPPEPETPPHIAIARDVIARNEALIDAAAERITEREAEIARAEADIVTAHFDITRLQDALANGVLTMPFRGVETPLEVVIDYWHTLVNISDGIINTARPDLDRVFQDVDRLQDQIGHARAEINAWLHPVVVVVPLIVPENEAGADAHPGAGGHDQPPPDDASGAGPGSGAGAGSGSGSGSSSSTTTGAGIDDHDADSGPAGDPLDLPVVDPVLNAGTEPLNPHAGDLQADAGEIQHHHDGMGAQPSQVTASYHLIADAQTASEAWQGLLDDAEQSYDAAEETFNELGVRIAAETNAMADQQDILDHGLASNAEMTAAAEEITARLATIAGLQVQRNDAQDEMAAAEALAHSAEESLALQEEIRAHAQAVINAWLGQNGHGHAEPGGAVPGAGHQVEPDATVGETHAAAPPVAFEFHAALREAPTQSVWVVVEMPPATGQVGPSTTLFNADALAQDLPALRALIEAWMRDMPASAGIGVTGFDLMEPTQDGAPASLAIEFAVHSDTQAAAHDLLPAEALTALRASIQVQLAAVEHDADADLVIVGSAVMQANT